MKKINSNWIGVAILIAAYVFSAGRFLYVSHGLNSSESEDSGQKIIRIAHWLLEPGVRESLQAAIDEYEALPHVKEQNIKILQAPIPQRMFNQFMNVHLISGTAPDIAIKGGSELVKGNALAKFYTPIGSYVNEPNPYNAPEYQREGLSDEESQYLETTPWKETFFDDLQGGYEEMLSDYYAIPISTWGGFRVIYNLDILEKVKVFAFKQSQLEPMPEWLAQLWRTPDNPDGYLSEASGLEWLGNDSVPQTMGQFILYCRAIQVYADAEGLRYLSPIAGSRYFGNLIMRQYEREFLSNYWKELDFEPGTKLHSMEVLSGYTDGKWDFDAPSIRAYFEFAKLIATFYPNGFLGMDREQAQRRFVLGQAAIITTGAWDVQSIYGGIAERDNPEDRFNVEIALKPLPGEDERWSEFVTMRISEAETKGQVPFAINKQTKHFDWALDFLKFLTSHRINEKYNESAGRLPVIVGAKPPEVVKAFAPHAHGIPQWFAMDFGKEGLPPTVKSAWSTNFKSYMVGDIEYDEVKRSMIEVLENPRIGIERAWVTSLQHEQDKSRDNDRAISIERLNSLLGSAEAAKREQSLFYLGLIEDEGVQLQRWWHKQYPDEPFPAF
ncbi:ABC transporter substrate-binding protein [Cerasicoccus frondis]|uniref:ABC transporter substrate-binding protein n=1 Tax=Cerasicoccus frondis TaxID=490090 RepID=UPI00285249E7|nr:extracellular solute-binding protein [Cerasicoccus frondis]